MPGLSFAARFEIYEEATLKKSSDFIRDLNELTSDAGLSKEFLLLIQPLLLHPCYENCFQVRRHPFQVYVHNLETAFSLLDQLETIAYKLINRIISTAYQGNFSSDNYRLVIDINRWILYLNLIHGELAHRVAKNPHQFVWLPQLSPETLFNAASYLQKPINRDPKYLTHIWRTLLGQLVYDQRSNGVRSCYYFESALMKIISRPIGAYVLEQLFHLLKGEEIGVMSDLKKLQVTEDSEKGKSNYFINIPSGSLRQPYMPVLIHYGTHFSQHGQANSVALYAYPTHIGVAHEVLHILDFKQTRMRRSFERYLVRDQWKNHEEKTVINEMLGCENAVLFFDYGLPIRVSHNGMELKNLFSLRLDKSTQEFWRKNVLYRFNLSLPVHLQIINLPCISPEELLARREVLSENSFNRRCRTLVT